MAKRARNITKRQNGVWYFTMLYKGERYSESLETADKEVAAARARLMREKIITKAWDKRLGLVVRGAATIGEILAAFDRYAMSRLGERTGRDYRSAVRLVLRRGLGRPELDDGAVGNLSSNVLSAKLVRDFESAFLGAAMVEVQTTGDVSKLASAKRSVNSYMRLARGVFTPAALDFYRAMELVLPEAGLTEFMKARVIEEPKLNRRPPSEEEVRPLFQAATVLKAADPDVYITWLTATWTGLRRGELRGLKRVWLKQMNGFWVFDLPEGWQKNGEADTVPVHPSLAAELQWYFKLQLSELVFPDGRVFGRVYEWMRGLGWTEKKFLHVMRRYFADQARRQHGEEWAKALMRHAEGSTLRQNYIGRPELAGKFVNLPMAALLPLQVAPGGDHEEKKA